MVNKNNLYDLQVKPEFLVTSLDFQPKMPALPDKNEAHTAFGTQIKADHWRVVSLPPVQTGKFCLTMVTGANIDDLWSMREQFHCRV
ncbi:MAG: hypothetical protein AAF641_08345 [Pseudomonadota bacterium]